MPRSATSIFAICVAFSFLLCLLFNRVDAAELSHEEKLLRTIDALSRLMIKVSFPSCFPFLLLLSHWLRYIYQFSTLAPSYIHLA